MVASAGVKLPFNAVAHGYHCLGAFVWNASVFGRSIGDPFERKGAALRKVYTRHPTAAVSNKLSIGGYLTQKKMIRRRWKDLDLVLVRNLQVKLVAFAEERKNTPAKIHRVLVLPDKRIKSCRLDSNRNRRRRWSWLLAVRQNRKQER